MCFIRIWEQTVTFVLYNINRLVLNNPNGECLLHGMHWIHIKQTCFIFKRLIIINCRTFFFFFYWRYNPLWVLAFSVIFFHSALSNKFLHPLIPIICISSSMSSVHLFLGLPQFLLPIGFYSSTLLGILFPSICITWPSQAILLLFTNFFISAFFIRSFSS